MDNIVILDSYEIVTDYVFNWTAFWIVAAALFIFVAIAYSVVVRDCEILPFTIACLGIWLVFTIIFGGLFGAILTATPSEYTTEYKVYIDGDIDMNAFIEKYDIIDQEGLIFKIREK